MTNIRLLLYDLTVRSAKNQPKKRKGRRKGGFNHNFYCMLVLTSPAWCGSEISLWSDPPWSPRLLYSQAALSCARSLRCVLTLIISRDCYYQCSNISYTIYCIFITNSYRFKVKGRFLFLWDAKKQTSLLLKPVWFQDIKSRSCLIPALPLDHMDWSRPFPMRSTWDILYSEHTLLE